MANRLTQIDLLIMMAEDSKAEGDDLHDEMLRKVSDHVRRSRDTLVRLEKAREALIADIRDWDRFLPKEEPQMPRVVTQGPKQ